MKTIALALFAVLLSSFFVIRTTSNPPLYPRFENTNPLLWKSAMGSASFRTNLYVDQNNVVIGSNGDRFLDYTLIDPTSGLYIINSKNGKIRKALTNQKWGDFDVNGVAVLNNRIYFGNDNEEFMCVDFNGQTIWKNVASGDVEGPPVVLEINNTKVVVYATELGEVKAVDPQTGRAVWSYFIPDFKGWKEGDSRTIFKVKAFFTNTQSFFTRPSVTDVNGDGVKDLVYAGYNDIIYCISGSDGKLLWSLDDPNTDFSVLVDERTVNGTTEFWLTSYVYNEKEGKYLLSLTRVDRLGKIIGKIPLQEENSFTASLNSFTAGPGQYLYATDDTLFQIDNNKVSKKLYIGEQFYYTSTWNNEVSNVPITRNSDDQLFGSDIFTYRGEDSCIALLSQHDMANFEHAFLTIVSLKSWRIVGKYSLPSSGEMPPQIKDINGDGKKEMLINCYDGNLYCYQLK